MTIQSTHGWIAISVDKNLKGKSAGADGGPRFRSGTSCTGTIDQYEKSDAPVSDLRSSWLGLSGYIKKESPQVEPLIGMKLTSTNPICIHPILSNSFLVASG